MNKTNEFSNYWRSWLVGLTQADKFDPLLTGKLVEVAERRAADLEVVKKEIFGPSLEEEIFAFLAANPFAAFAALCVDRSIDPLLTEFSQRTKRKFNSGVRDILISDLVGFSDDERALVQGFLDRQFPVVQDVKGEDHE